MKFKMKLSFLLALVLLFSPVLLMSAFAEDALDDNIGPRVLGNNVVQLYTGKTRVFTVSAYDSSDLSDNIFTPEDFTVSAYGFSLNPVAEVVAVSEPYESPSSPYYTCWDITVKGVLPGRASLQVRKNVIWDIYGNGNPYSTATIIRTGGLFTYLFHLVLNGSF